MLGSKDLNEIMANVGLKAIPDTSGPVTDASRPILASSSRRTGGIDAVVTQGWGRIAYNIVRSLGRKGVKVALGTDEYRGMAALSSGI